MATATSSAESARRWLTRRFIRLGPQAAERKRVEEIFGWLVTVALLRKTRHRGKRRVGVDLSIRSGRVQPAPNAEPRVGIGMKKPLSDRMRPGCGELGESATCDPPLKQLPEVIMDSMVLNRPRFSAAF